MEYPEELIIERVNETLLRAIVFERDPDSGARSVKDIAEMTYDPKKTGSWLASWYPDTDLMEDRITEVNFGKATSRGGRFQKYVDHIFAQRWPPVEPDAPDAKEFTFRTYRCEWQIYAEQIDQYGQTIPMEGTKVYDSYGTVEEARAHQLEFLKEISMGRLIPKDATHTYWYGGVRYVEVQTVEWKERV